MKKKKVLLALLASVCVAAGASAFAACSDNGGSSYDPALYAAYQTYKESTPDPMSYNEWLEDILDKLANGGIEGPKGETGEKGVGIKNIEISEDGKFFHITFTDGTTQDVPIENEG